MKKQGYANELKNNIDYRNKMRQLDNLMQQQESKEQLQLMEQNAQRQMQNEEAYK